MDLVSTCKDKLLCFRIKELKDVLTQLGLSKQGRKQDLVDRILTIVANDQVSKVWAKRSGFARDDVVRLVDATYRKLQIPGAIDLASKGSSISEATGLTSKGQGTSDSGSWKPSETVDSSFQSNMKVRCPCGKSLPTESMIRCESPRCQIWQHISCVIIPEKPVDGFPSVPAQFICELCRLSRADPFWSTVQQLVSPVKLTTKNMPTDGTNPIQCVELTFQLTRTDRDLLSKPEFAIQVWCMLLNDKVPFRMQWPQYTDLQVNGMPVRAINRPGSQLLGANGRDDGPIISQCTMDGINRISITGCDTRIFCVGVRLVKRLSLEQIMNMIPKESDGECFKDALARVCRCVGGGGDADNADDSDSDLEVVADSFTVNLRCPMSGSRMKIAGRFKPCVHMGCFDLQTFVEMQQRSRKWQCPICLKNYSLEDIIIDPYFNRITAMMQCCGEDTTEIEVKPDGCWRVKGENERTDLKQWHLPDGSLCMSVEGQVKHEPEESKPIKLEGTGLKLGIRKNSNGLWEVSKNGDINALSSTDKMQERFGNGDVRVNNCVSGGGRDGVESVDQDRNANLDLSANNVMEFESMSLNLEQEHGFPNQNPSQVARDAEVVLLSDSDEENDMISPGTIHKNDQIDNGVDFSVDLHGISGSYQDDPGFGAGRSSCLDLFNAPDDEFGVPPWQLPSTTLMGSGCDSSHLGSLNCPMSSTNGYLFPPDATVDPDFLMSNSPVGHSNNDMNDGLVDNPLAFGGVDPSLQMFLPPKPYDGCRQNDARNLQRMMKGLRSDDWISLRVGDGGDGNQGNSVALNGLDLGQPIHSSGAAMDISAETASFLLGSNGSKSEKTRERSDSPFATSLLKRSVRPRLHLSIDSDTD